jgi:hypothetical protein
MYNNQLSNGLSNGKGCAMGDQCCKNMANGVMTNGDCTAYEEVLFSKTEYTPYDPSQEPIFPPKLRVCTFCCVCGRKKCYCSDVTLWGVGQSNNLYPFPIQY